MFTIVSKIRLQMQVQIKKVSIRRASSRTEDQTARVDGLFLSLISRSQWKQKISEVWYVSGSYRNAKIT